MGRLTGKTAVITGGNSGIGLATAKSFVDEGAQVIIFGRNADRLEQVRETLGENLYIVQGDVANSEDLARLAVNVKLHLSKIDVLFVNAGVAEFQPLTSADEQHFDRLFNINVRGAYFTIKALEPLLNDGASVILTTSSSNQLGLPGSSIYAATKAALRSFAQTLSAELVGRVIRVNAISPGPSETPIYTRMGVSEEDQAEAEKALLSRIPLARMGQPSEIAKSVLFLASNESSFMVGAEMVVDGGMSQL